MAQLKFPSSLLRNSNFILLCAGQMLTAVADWALIILLQIKIYELTQTAASVALLMVCEIVPMLLVGLVAGVFVDRWNKKKVIAFSSLLKGLSVVFFLLLPVTWHTPVSLYVLVAIIGITAGFFQPAINAILPLIVASDQLKVGNSTMISIRTIGLSMGALLASFMFAQVGETYALFSSSLVFMLGAATYTLMMVGTYSQLTKQPGDHRSILHELGEGLALLQGSVRHVIVMAAVLALIMGSLEVVAIVFISHELGLPTERVGILFGGYGAGMLIGLFIVSKLQIVRVFSGMSAGFLITSISFVCAALADDFTVATGFIMLAGVGEGLVLPLIMMTLYKHVHALHHGRIFAIQDTVMSAAFLVAVMVSGGLTDYVGARTVLFSNAVILLVAGLWCALLTSSFSSKRSR